MTKQTRDPLQTLFQRAYSHKALVLNPDEARAIAAHLIQASERLKEAEDRIEALENPPPTPNPKTRRGRKAKKAAAE